MINIAICDDSIEFQRVFRGAINKCLAEVFPDTLAYKVLECFTNSEDVLKYLNKDVIDILFLDIDLPGMNGMELAKRLVWKNADTIIVFVSGYDQFVYEVFEFSPFAFLRKDRIIDELPKTLERIAERFEKRNTDVEIITVDGKYTLCARDTLYIKSKGNYYSCFEKSGRELSCRGTLSDAEKLFERFGFFRVHSAYLVNLHHIQRIEKSDVFVGVNMKPIPIAQRRLADFRHAYAEFMMRRTHI